MEQTPPADVCLPAVRRRSLQTEVAKRRTKRSLRLCLASRRRQGGQQNAIGDPDWREWARFRDTEHYLCLTQKNESKRLQWRKNKRPAQPALVGNAPEDRRPPKQNLKHKHEFMLIRSDPK
ncbi:hypothetical protein KSP39_PZI003510 [Platanthera zijinensis]|uniref:Uncharacterized protein n=1 Tax=Platanthera zijinensis TaxID=2320716 RepID=A0AAP0GCL0_9ASPA